MKILDFIGGPIANSRARCGCARMLCLLMTIFLGSTSSFAETANNEIASNEINDGSNQDPLVLNHSDVEVLSYGVILYEFFQRNYFNTLAETLVAEQRHELGSLVDEVRLLSGGVYLSYGMDQEAQRIFKMVIPVGVDQLEPTGSRKAKKTDRKKRNEARAYFYLGKLQYQKGLHQQALTTLSNVNSNLNPELHNEYSFLTRKLRLQLSDSENELARNSDELNDDKSIFSPALKSQSVYRFYDDYNHAVAQLRSSLTTISFTPLNAEVSAAERQATLVESVNQVAEKLERLERALGRFRDADRTQVKGARREANDNVSLNQDIIAELSALRDRVLTALGFTYLQLDQVGKATTAFSKVRQNSELIGNALVGYGWAALEAGNYERALAPMRVLESRSMSDPTTHEALLAVPFIYQQLGHNDKAIAAYAANLIQFNSELVTLEQLERNIDLHGFAALFDIERLTQSVLHKVPELPLGEGEGDAVVGEQVDRSDNSETGIISQTDFDKEKRDQSQRLQSGHDWLDMERSLVTLKHMTSESIKGYFVELLARKSSREMFAQLNDSYWLESNMAKWSERIEMLELTATERQKKNETWVSQGNQTRLAGDLQRLQERRDQLKEKMESARWQERMNSYSSESLASYKILMNSDELRILQRIDAGIKKLEKIENDRNKVVAKITNLDGSEKGLAQDAKLAKLLTEDRIVEKRTALLKSKGLLLWRVGNSSAQRYRNLALQIREIDQVSAESTMRMARFPALVEQQTQQAAYRNKLAEKRIVIANTQDKLLSLRSKLEQKLSMAMANSLAQKRQRIRAYLGQARLAQATLLDKTRLEKTRFQQSNSKQPSAKKSAGLKGNALNDTGNGGSL